uniref:transposase n=1 Tax=Klebsiella oxytoca TaxID=571 RepID=UPI0021AE9A6C|nr:transposase [Klebsiella oxytoca]
MLRWACKQGLEVGIFCALHTYGRQLNQHPHIHLSVTRGGLDIKHGVWRNIFFKKHAVEKIWRGAVTRLLRHSYNLINPGSLPGLGHIRDKKTVAMLSAGAVRTSLEGPLCEENPRSLAERQISR